MARRDLLPIKEFMKLTGVKESTLRYYDKIGLFSPASRGDNNYRYYSPRQIVTIKTLGLLNDCGLPTRTISDVAKRRTPEKVLEILEKEEASLGADFEKIQRFYDVIKMRRRLVAEALTIDENSLSIEKGREVNIAIGGRNDFSTSPLFYGAFVNFCKEAEAREIDLRFPVGGLFEDFDSFVAHPNEPDFFFSLDLRGKTKTEPGDFLVAYSRGYYGQTGDITERVSDYIEKNKLVPKGPVYNIFILDEFAVKSTSNYLMRCSVRVEKA